ncbi:MAG: acylphosphatase [Candidatus Aminicenantes bacterium]|nr:acylphosphatase [Candidatus Aminicenantes bacterium]
MKTNRYIVKGIVQGVAFRHYTMKAAQDYKIKGTVKNLYNGDVEVYAQGADESIKLFEDFLKNGPRSARVDKVIKKVKEIDETYTDFDIIF